MDELVPDIMAQQEVPEEEQQPVEQAQPEEPSVRAKLVKFREYGPAVGDRPTRAVTYGPLGKLQPGDIAVAPNMLADHPLGSYMAINTPDGVVHGRVADTSWVDEGHPNHDTVEFWNRKAPSDSGYVAPITVQQMIDATPERARLAGDQPTAASIENAMPEGSGQAPDITNPDTGAPDMTAGADVQDIADQVTENLKAQQPEAQSTEETAPIPTDPSKMQYDPEHDMASWEFNGKRWYIARGMTKPAELKETKADVKYIKDEMGTQWAIKNGDYKNAEPVNLTGSRESIDISKIKEGDWDSVPESIRAQAQLYANYKGPNVTGFALRTPYFQKLFEIISKVDPSFNYQEYKKRQETITDFGSKGKSGQNITSFNTAIDHLGSAWENSKELASSLNQTEGKYTNKAQLFWKDLWGGNKRANVAYGAYKDDVEALKGETDKAVTGQSTVAGRSGWDEVLDPSTPPSARMAGLAEKASLMGARLKENYNAYKSGMGGQEPNFSMLRPDAEETLQKILPELDPKSTAATKIKYILKSFGSDGGKKPYFDPEAQQGPSAQPLIDTKADQGPPEAPYGGRQTIRRINKDQSDPSKAYIIYDAKTQEPLGYEP